MVSSNLFDQSYRYFSVSLGLQDWRQLVAFVQDFFGAETALRQALSDPSVRMFVYSLSNRAGHYGVDEDRLPGQSSQEMAGQAAASRQWHAILGLD